MDDSVGLRHSYPGAVGAVGDHLPYGGFECVEQALLAARAHLMSCARNRRGTSPERSRLSIEHMLKDVGDRASRATTQATEAT